MIWLHTGQDKRCMCDPSTLHKAGNASVRGTGLPGTGSGTTLRRNSRHYYCEEET